MAVSYDKTRKSAPGTVVMNRTVCTDENYTVLDDDSYVELITTGAGARTLTFGTAGRPGHVVAVVMSAVNTGTYTTVGVVDGNQVLFDAAGEAATFICNDAGSYQVLGVGLPAPTRP